MMGKEQYNDYFSIRIAGPGLDSTLAIFSEDDFSSVDAMLNKIKKSVLLKNKTSLDVKKGKDDE